MTIEADMVRKALENGTVLDVLCMKSGLSARQVVEALDELCLDAPAPPLGEEGDIFVELDYQLYFKIPKPFGLMELEDLIAATTRGLQKLEADVPEDIYAPERVRYAGYALCKNEGDQHGTN